MMYDPDGENDSRNRFRRTRALMGEDEANDFMYRYGSNSQDAPQYHYVQYQPQQQSEQQEGGLGDLSSLASLAQAGYGAFGGQSAAAGGAAATPAAGSGAGAAGGGSAGMMGSLGPIGAIAAAVMMAKGAEADEKGSPMGSLMGSLNAPSVTQVMADPKTGVTTAFGMPFLNGFIRNEKSANARPEWEGLFGGMS